MGRELWTCLDESKTDVVVPISVRSAPSIAASMPSASWTDSREHGQMLLTFAHACFVSCADHWEFGSGNAGDDSG